MKFYTLAFFPAACKNEAKWMFNHLDINSDGLLSTSELYDLENDQNERCIKPFIDGCNLDNNDTLSPREWCRCFEKTDRPCAAIRRRSKIDLLGRYIPSSFSLNNSLNLLYLIKNFNLKFSKLSPDRRLHTPDCDIQGFYKPTQCHSLVGVCWCVDKHGVEFASTRTKGKPNCGRF